MKNDFFSWMIAIGGALLFWEIFNSQNGNAQLTQAATQLSANALLPSTSIPPTTPNSAGIFGSSIWAPVNPQASSLYNSNLNLTPALNFDGSQSPAVSSDGIMGTGFLL
jgi:hypothetical protein